MKVIILAGGFGTRLSEYTETIPKPMVTIGGRPILWHIMKRYAHFGHKDFYLALGYKSESIKEYFLNYRSLNADFTVDLATGDIEPYHVYDTDWRVTLVDTGLKTMTGGRIKRLKKFIGNEPFLLTYGDGVSDVDITALLKHHRSHGKIATVTAVRPSARFGGMRIGEGQVINFEEKPWFMKRHNQETILGIGRPRCGFLTVDNDGVISHNQTETNSPVNLGIKTNYGFLLGHSDGTITEIDDCDRKYTKCGDDSITAMFSNNISWKIGNVIGNLFSSDGWVIDLDGKISGIVETEDHICVSINSEENIIYLLDKESGSIEYQFNHENKIQIMTLSNYNLAISDEEGKIMFFDVKTLNKRIEEKKDINEDLDRRNLLKKRLRALRK